jgi:hypothetical protein
VKDIIFVISMFFVAASYYFAKLDSNQKDCLVSCYHYYLQINGNLSSEEASKCKELCR